MADRYQPPQMEMRELAPAGPRKRARLEPPVQLEEIVVEHYARAGAFDPGKLQPAFFVAVHASLTQALDRAAARARLDDRAVPLPCDVE